jgi:hypothetical protein
MDCSRGVELLRESFCGRRYFAVGTSLSPGPFPTSSQFPEIVVVVVAFRVLSGPETRGVFINEPVPDAGELVNDG